MTEKRFKYTFEGIEDTLESDEEYKYTPCNKDGFQDLCEMLNELNNENKQLKSINQDHKDHLADFYADYDRLEKENEQLKSDLKSYQNMVKQYINLHIDKIRRRYVNPTKEEVVERTRIIRDLEQLKKELQEND